MVMKPYTDFRFNDMAFAALLAQQGNIPTWPHEMLTVGVAAVIPYKDHPGALSIIIGLDGTLYAHRNRTNVLVKHTHAVSGLTKPIIWALGAPELYRHAAIAIPPIHRATVWLDDKHGFLGLGMDLSRPRVWVNVRQLRQIHWVDGQLCVHLRFDHYQRRLTFGLGMKEDVLTPLLQQTHNLYCHANGQQVKTLPFAGDFERPEPPRGYGYNLWTLHRQVQRYVMAEVTTRYQFHDKRTQARKFIEGWLLLVI